LFSSFLTSSLSPLQRLHRFLHGDENDEPAPPATDCERAQAAADGPEGAAIGVFRDGGGDNSSGDGVHFGGSEEVRAEGREGGREGGREIEKGIATGHWADVEENGRPSRVSHQPFC
jgi:hypothetical protein